MMICMIRFTFYYYVLSKYSIYYHYYSTPIIIYSIYIPSKHCSIYQLITYNIIYSTIIIYKYRYYTNRIPTLLSTNIFDYY